MANQQKNDRDSNAHQGAPQDTQNMPSSGNSPTNTGATSGTFEGTRGSDVERSGGAGTATGAQRTPDVERTTDEPGRTPGKAEGVEDSESRGNQ